MCMRGFTARRANMDIILEKNHIADAAARAAPKINNRYVIQDDSAGTAAAARSSSLTSFGSTTYTAFAFSASVASTRVAPGALAPVSSVFGRSG